MKKRKIFTVSFLFYAILLQAHQVLEEQLSYFPQIHSFRKIETIGTFSSCYEIFIKQAVSNNDNSAGTFNQRIYLSHRDFKKPTLLFISGYLANGNKVNEWSTVLDANQIYIEQRYFGDSKPGKIEWETMNFENICRDIHEIRLLFGKIYPGKWINTGISRGGLTAVAHKYYYPDDVDATIALSTSVKTTACDISWYSHIDSLSNVSGCKEKLKKLQLELLYARDSIIPLLEEHLVTHGKEFCLLGIHKIFETAVMEIPFSLWQNKKGCETVNILQMGSSEDMFQSLCSAINYWFLTDDVLNEMAPYNYHALTECGYYCYPVAEFQEGLQSPGILSSVYPPSNTNPLHSPEFMLTLRKWLTRQGNNIIYISGSNDPYSIFRINPSDSVNSISYLLENKNHNQTGWTDLNIDQKRDIKNLLENWLR